MGRDCASKRVPIALAEGRSEDLRGEGISGDWGGPAKLPRARALHRDPQDHVAVFLARPARRAQPVCPQCDPDHRGSGSAPLFACECWEYVSLPEFGQKSRPSVGFFPYPS
jgi:hypothetical protein